MKSPLDWTAEQIMRLSPSRQAMLGEAIIYFMTATFLTIMAYGLGIDVILTLLG